MTAGRRSHSFASLASPIVSVLALACAMPVQDAEIGLRLTATGKVRWSLQHGVQDLRAGAPRPGPAGSSTVCASQ